MESPKITVIVPVYNVAAYIEKCAISLFQQTLDSLEILFIDDCSPDNSVEIIKETLKKYPVRNSLTRIISFDTFFDDIDPGFHVFCLENICDTDIGLSYTLCAVESACRCEHAGFTVNIKLCKQEH